MKTLSNCSCCPQTPDDPLHQINLGLWVHLLSCITHGIQQTLQSPVTDEKIGKGGKVVPGKRVIGDERMQQVWKRLDDRLGSLEKSTAGIFPSRKVCSFASEMQKRKSEKRSKVSFKSFERCTKPSQVFLNFASVFKCFKTFYNILNCFLCRM